MATCSNCKQESETIESYQFPDDTDAGNLCTTCAAQNGFCIICGSFCAGTEDYDFSPITGICGQCVEELRYENGEFDEPDDYFDY